MKFKNKTFTIWKACLRSRQTEDIAGLIFSLVINTCPHEAALRSCFDRVSDESSSSNCKYSQAMILLLLYFQLIFRIFWRFRTKKGHVDALSKGYKLSRLDPQLIIADDFEMNKLLFIALFGLVFAISLAFPFDHDDNEKELAAIKETRNHLER